MALALDVWRLAAAASWAFRSKVRSTTPCAHCICKDSRWTDFQRSMATSSSSSSSSSWERHQSIMAGLGERATGIPVRAENVEILVTPTSFYEALKQGIMGSSNRIALASLYIGLGHLERDLLDVIAETVIAQPSLRVTLLFDALRSTRPTSSKDGVFRNSSGMLSELLVSKCKKASAEGRVQVSLYYTPDLTKTLKRVLPPRINEVVGVCHLKAYVFDDNVLISGANLSETYFTNRQDRYVWFRNSKELADHFTSLIDIVASFSYKLGESGELIPNAVVNPLEDPSTFRLRMAESVNSLISCKNKSEPGTTGHNNEAGSRKDENFLCLNGTWSNTWVFPTVQMGPLGLQQDELCTLWLLKNLVHGSELHLASAYFNLTPELEHALLEASVDKIINILTASPQANGFYGAAGVSGFIPHAYSLLEKSLYERGQKIHDEHKNSKGRLCIYEYTRPDWTFHAKGLWCSLPEEDGSGGSAATSLTLIGSSNFGYRSRHRDLEAQLFVITLDPNLRTLLEDEKAALYSWAKPVHDGVFHEQGRVNSLAAAVAARAMRSWL